MYEIVSLDFETFRTKIVHYGLSKTEALEKLDKFRKARGNNWKENPIVHGVRASTRE